MQDWERMIGTVTLGDALELMRRLPDDCVDVILTDPPYFKVMREDWDRQWKNIEEFQAWVGEVGDEMRRVLKSNGSLYWFGDEHTAAYCQVELDKRFGLINSLVWLKPSPCAAKYWSSMRSYIDTCERILFYGKDGEKRSATGWETIQSNPECFKPLREYLRGERAKAMRELGMTAKEFDVWMQGVTGYRAIHRHYFQTSQFLIPTREVYAKMQATSFFRREYEEMRREYEEMRRPWVPDAGAKNVLEFSVPATARREHPCQKPVPLLRYLLERSTRPGALVLDPFAGSGSTHVAAQSLGLRCVSIEREEKWRDVALRRIANEARQGELELR